MDTYVPVPETEEDAREYDSLEPDRGSSILKVLWTIFLLIIVLLTLNLLMLEVTGKQIPFIEHALDYVYGWFGR